MLAILLLAAAPALAQKPAGAPAAAAKSEPAPAQLADWTKLIDANKCEAARQLCNGYVNDPQIGQQVEAQKCLANVALCGHDVVTLQGTGNGGGLIAGGYTDDAVNESLAHLNAAMKLAPQDLSIHEGRLHVLEVAMRYQAMVKALDESCSIYKGPYVPDAWLAYGPELEEVGQYQTAVEFMQVLNRHYPNNSDILGNIGAFLSMEGKGSEAIPYLQQAVKLAPSDPINTWDLGRAYDYAGQVKLADEWYQTGLSLQTGKGQQAEEKCLYGQFVEQELHDRARGCALEKQGCAAKEQTACAPAAPSTAHAPGAKGSS